MRVILQARTLSYPHTSCRDVVRLRYALGLDVLSRSFGFNRSILFQSTHLKYVPSLFPLIIDYFFIIYNSLLFRCCLILNTFTRQCSSPFSNSLIEFEQVQQCYSPHCAVSLLPPAFCCCSKLAVQILSAFLLALILTAFLSF